MEEQIHLFLNYLSEGRGYAPNTIQAYRNDLNQFMYFAQVEKPNLVQWSWVDKPLLITFLSHLSTHKYTASSISRKVAVLKTFLHYLLQNKLIHDDPSTSLPAPRVQKKPPRVLSLDEIERLLSCPGRQATPKALRDRAILELLYASGMRATEMISLNVGDIRLSDGSVLCGMDQANRREIPIPQSAVDALGSYLQRGRSTFPGAIGEQALFLNPHGERLTRQGLWLIIKECVKRAEIETPVTPDTIRHSFAVHMLSRGERLTMVQRLLGHSSVATTQGYVRLVEKPAGKSDGSNGIPGHEALRV